MGETAKATLLIASAEAESRERWGGSLKEEFSVSEVAKRGTLEQVMASLRPDVLVLDLALPRLGRLRGLPSIRRLSLSTKTLVLTDAPAENEGVFALKAGAKGYYTRAIEPANLKKAVETVQKGEIWVQRELVTRLVAEVRSLSERRGSRRVGKSGRGLDRLTARQRLIAGLIAEGASNGAIARQLEITESTVKAHVTAMFRNLGISNRLQLALLLNGHARRTRVRAPHREVLPPGSQENQQASVDPS